MGASVGTPYFSEMALLKKAGVDLAQPDTVRAVVDQLDDLVTRLEKELSVAQGFSPAGAVQAATAGGGAT